MSPDQPSSHTSQAYGHPIPHRDIAFSVGLLLLTVGQASVRYVRLLTNDISLHPDARLVWRPLARAVRKGAALYVDPVTDNKPPLFELLNILVASTDAYAFTFLLIIALVNGCSAILLYRLFVQHQLRWVGTLAAVLFLFAVPLVSGHAINVRSFAVCAFLVSLSVRRAELCGTAIAVGVLFSQYLVLGIPIVWWWALRAQTPRRSPWRWALRYVAAGIGVALVSYGSVFVIWGWPSFLGSLYWSIGVAERYFTVYGPSVWIGQRAWILYTGQLIATLWPLLVLAGVGGTAVITDRILNTVPSHIGRPLGSHVLLSSVAAVLFGGLLLVRPYETYWMYSLPWIAVLAAVGIRTIVVSFGSHAYLDTSE